MRIKEYLDAIQLCKDAESLEKLGIGDNFCIVPDSKLIDFEQAVNHFKERIVLEKPIHPQLDKGKFTEKRILEMGLNPSTRLACFYHKGVVLHIVHERCAVVCGRVIEGSLPKIKFMIHTGHSCKEAHKNQHAWTCNFDALSEVVELVIAVCEYCLQQGCEPTIPCFGKILACGEKSYTEMIFEDPAQQAAFFAKLEIEL